MALGARRIVPDLELSRFRARSKRRRSASPERICRIALGPSILTGALAVTRPVGADAGRIYADLDLGRARCRGAAEPRRRPIAGRRLRSLARARSQGFARRPRRRGQDRRRLARSQARADGPEAYARPPCPRRTRRRSVRGDWGRGPGWGDRDGAPGRGQADRFRRARVAPGSWTVEPGARGSRPLLSPASVAFEARAGPSARRARRACGR